MSFINVTFVKNLFTTLYEVWAASVMFFLSLFYIQNSSICFGASSIVLQKRWQSISEDKSGFVYLIKPILFPNMILH